MKVNKVQLKQENMLCHRCVLNVVKALSRIDGIRELEVSLEKKWVKIVYNNENLSRYVIQDIVNDSIVNGRTELFH